MREHKYRAWDKTEQNFIYFTAKDGLLSQCDKAYIKLNIKKIDQHIGLKDKNGKEIYNRDIVRLEYWNAEDNITFFKNEVVEYNEKNCSFEINGKGISELDSLLWKDSDCGIEVIGNKFENAELLEEKKK